MTATWFVMPPALAPVASGRSASQGDVTRPGPLHALLDNGGLRNSDQHDRRPTRAPTRS
jgi:hypothetical protein